MVFQKDTKKRWVAAAAALAVFLLVSVLYFAPQFRGEVLPQHDVLQYEGMSRDIYQTREATGEDPQWTGGMFSGMPAYLINVAYPAQLVKNTVGRITRLIDTPAGFLLFAMVSMWLMLLVCGVDPWVGIVPALAYGLSTYFLLIIGAGHVTKMWALVYAPLMMGGAWMTLRGNLWAGAAITALAASLEIGANHPQITYYFLLAMAAFWISEGIVALRERHLKEFLRRTAVLAAAGLLAVGSNFAPLWYTARHAKETIRGGSELAAAAETQNPESSDRGLDLDYATAWSYGRAETLNLLVPDFMGRDSGWTFPSDGQVAATANEYGLRGIERQLPAYWGTQPYTAGPTYLGAAALFLAVLGALLVRGRNRWWIVAVCAVMLLLAWGRNFMAFTELAFKLLPGYDKFRTVSMTLVVVQWAVPLLGAMALMRLWRGDVPRKRLLRALAWAGGVTGGLCLLLAVAGGSLFDFGRGESTVLMTDQLHQLFQSNGMQEYIDRGMDVEMGEAIGAAMAADRAAMMQADAWRSLLMIALAAGGVALFAFGRIRRGGLVALLGGVVLLDLVPVDLRFLSSEDFVSPRRRQITATAADKAILADRTPGFRVLNLTVSPFNDATTSYFHRSVGGYHGAKLARYQDLIDRYLSQLDEGVLDMLNTRYLILPGEDGQPVAQLRTTANGAAWFVDRLVTAEDARQEIDLLGKTDLKTTAVIAARDLPLAQLPAAAAADTLPGRSIALVEYHANRLRYEYSTPAEAVAVFSEIYYDKGWTATIDGEEAPAFRADYVLRAMRLPAGTHVVEWRFRAPGWRAAETVTGICSVVILVSAAAAVVLAVRRKRRGNGRQEATNAAE
ncbi:YfhO family protein [uncultured Alistipes sp.]|uniref:YfhO family protein n=1 Tax=uncultured Alistipes sp. TaxID=538949 RepID=UPI0025DFBAA3|nr:YfhO family protein [uncultured Alistipes sp.]